MRWWRRLASMAHTATACAAAACKAQSIEHAEQRLQEHTSRDPAEVCASIAFLTGLLCSRCAHWLSSLNGHVPGWLFHWCCCATAYQVGHRAWRRGAARNALAPCRRDGACFDACADQRHSGTHEGAGPSAVVRTTHSHRARTFALICAAASSLPARSSEHQAQACARCAPDLMHRAPFGSAPQTDHSGTF